MVSAEDQIPNRKVGVVLGVMVALMVNAMGLRALEDGSEPAGRFDVQVVEIFCHCGEEGVKRGSFHGEPEESIR